MKLAVSNIGWERHDDPAVLEALRQAGVTGIEVAPTKVWPGWEGASAEAAGRYREFLAGEGFQIPAMQAILFGKPELKLFDPSPAVQAGLVEHTKLVADLAQAFGARVLVFGAPKNRIRGELPLEQALGRAAEIFQRLGELCSERGTRLCIEANPVEYGCDFVTNAVDALSLVERTDSPGFGLHLDAAGMYMAGDPFDTLLPRALPRLCHYHISEPFLTGFSEAQVPHARWLRAVREAGYPHWFSVEVDGKKHELGHTLRFLQETVAESAESEGAST